MYGWPFIELTPASTGAATAAIKDGDVSSIARSACDETEMDVRCLRCSSASLVLSATLRCMGVSLSTPTATDVDVGDDPEEEEDVLSDHDSGRRYGSASPPMSSTTHRRCCICPLPSDSLAIVTTRLLNDVMSLAVRTPLLSKYALDGGKDGRSPPCAPLTGLEKFVDVEGGATYQLGLRTDVAVRMERRALRCSEELVSLSVGVTENTAEREADNGVCTLTLCGVREERGE